MCVGGKAGGGEVNTGYGVFSRPVLCFQIEACSVKRVFLPLSETETGQGSLFFSFFLFGSLTNFASGLMTNLNQELGHFENMTITLQQNTTRRAAVLVLLNRRVDAL